MKNSNVFVLLAGGTSQRMGGDKKELSPLSYGSSSYGNNALQQLVDMLNLLPCITHLHLVYHPNYQDSSLASIQAFNGTCTTSVAGDTRQASVCGALQAIADYAPTYVLIHDGARPWLTHTLTQNVLDALENHAAVLPIIALTDSLKQLDADGQISHECNRAQFALAQTPQGFHFDKIYQAHQELSHQQFSDDAMLYYAYYQHHAHAIVGDVNNSKITYPKDLIMMQQPQYRIGLGEDIHRLGASRALVLAGIPVQASGGPHAHSDGDVVLHALIDALLGALALGDIGDHFPPSDPQYQDIDSTTLLLNVLDLIQQRHYQIVNLDVTIRLEQPKLSPFKQAMQVHLARLLALADHQVAIKAKSSEGVDAVGSGDAVFAQAIVLLCRYG